MDLHVRGKRALITGSSAGLGEAIAHMLSSEGVEVIIHGRHTERVNQVANAIRKQGGMAHTAIGDLSTDEGADTVASSALKTGPIDILVNNAGSYTHSSWMETSPKDWLDSYNTNVVSYVRMVQRLLPSMKEKGWGRIIHIGGGLGIQPFAGHPHYNATLAARHNLSVSLARELSNTGITSNVIAPGAIMNPQVEKWLIDESTKYNWGNTLEEIEQAAVKQLVPNDRGRLGRPQEIAAAVLYLVGPHSDYTSGALLRVDGGTVRSIN